jgi:hypothetical protein
VRSRKKDEEAYRNGSEALRRISRILRAEATRYSGWSFLQNGVLNAISTEVVSTGWWASYFLDALVEARLLCWLIR